MTPPRTGKPSLVFRVSRAGAGTKRARREHRHHHPLAHAAGDPADTISDYKFAPATITIHVGDTITWTNDGPSAHTATANDGSFDTGTLNKGQSGSHTFAKAGTVAYICTIHPFMKGTVIVLTNATTQTNSNSHAATTPTATTASATTTPTTPASGQSLPNTGLDLAATLGAGLLLVGIGAAIARRTRSS